MKKEFVMTVLCFVFLFVGLASANAATLTVTKIADTNDNVCDADCSLREAIFAAASGDTIEFASPLFDAAQTIELNPAFGALVPERSITIIGKGANLTTISGSFAIRVFVLVGNVSLVGLRIANGRDVGTGNKYGAGIFNDGNSTITNCIVSGNLVSGTVGGRGGGIYNAPGKQLKIVDSTIFGNVANNINANGGGIYNDSGGILSIVNSTVSGNTAALRGGGIQTNSTLNITNSTITQNSIGGQEGGGVFKTSGTLRAVNTIISNNTASFGGNPDVEGQVDLNLQNFIGGNAQLAALGENGGTTPTFAPASASSPVVNAGNSCVLTANSCGFEHPALTTDQRGAGFPRLSGSAVDIGSVEADTFTFTPATLPAATLNTVYSQQITVTGGIAPHTFTLNSGTLPTGITLSSGGLLSGTTAQAGDFNFTVRATGANGFFGLKSYVLSAGYYVTNANGSGAGSLRQLINDAPAGGTIRFDPAFFNVPRTIPMSGAILTVNKNLTINGPGANLLTLDGENATQLFSISNVTLTLTGMRLTRGFAGFNGGAVVLSGGILNAALIRIDGSRANNKGGGIALFGGTLNLTDSIITGNSSGVEGGGIRLEPGSNATITYSTVSNNSTESENGGAIAGYNAGFVLNSSTLSGNRAVNGGAVFMGGFGNSVINNSTVSGNTATTGRGGAILIIDAVRLDTTNTTITNNKNKSGQTGGIVIQSPAEYLTRNTIIAGNCNQNDELDCRSTSTTGNPDAAGIINSFGYNLLGSTTGNSYINNTTGNRVGAAQLAPLGDYGGATQTHALFSNSQAINAGDTNNSFATDQRISTRPIDGRGDIGSFERNVNFDQSTLPNGSAGSTYSQQLSASRQSLAENGLKTETQYFAPTNFAVLAGSLPPGITLSPSGLLSGMPTTAGPYIFIVKATDTDGMAGAQQFTIQVLSPTAASVRVSGRLLTPDGRGLNNARVILTDSNGNVRTVLSSTFGYYRFDEVGAGQTYIISVASKRYQFQPQVVTVTDEIEELNLTANE